MKNIAYVLAGAALVFAPVAANAQRGASHSSHMGSLHVGGRVSAGGSFSHGSVYRGSGYRGGFYRGGHGYFRYRSAWPFFYGPALGLYLGYYADPWFWGYPGYDYYGYPVYPYPPEGYAAPAYPPPAADQSNNGSAVAPQSGQAPTDCGHWQWDAAKRQYQWIAKACQ